MGTDLCMLCLVWSGILEPIGAEPQRFRRCMPFRRIHNVFAHIAHCQELDGSAPCVRQFPEAIPYLRFIRGGEIAIQNLALSSGNLEGGRSGPPLRGPLRVPGPGLGGKL
jgi:hypothetical protein